MKNSYVYRKKFPQTKSVCEGNANTITNSVYLDPFKTFTQNITRMSNIHTAFNFRKTFDFSIIEMIFTIVTKEEQHIN